MFSNSQNNIFTDDMEFALGASSCLEFNGPNDRALLPNLMEDYEEKFSAEERLRKDKEVRQLATIRDDSSTFNLWTLLEAFITF